MSLNELKVLVGMVNVHLRNNDFFKLADEFEKYLDEFENGNAESLEEIVKRCHIKWAGDMPIQDVAFDEWIQLLEKTKLAAIYLKSK